MLYVHINKRNMQPIITVIYSDIAVYYNIRLVAGFACCSNRHAPVQLSELLQLLYILYICKYDIYARSRATPTIFKYITLLR